MVVGDRMKSILLAVLSVGAFTIGAADRPTYPTEPEVCRELFATGEYTGIEVPLWDGTRVDLTTETEAIEVDWARSKWAEGIGQALYYSQVTGKKPVVLLLVKDIDAERRYVYRAQTVAAAHGIRIQVHRVGARP